MREREEPSDTSLRGAGPAYRQRALLPTYFPGRFAAV